MRRLKRRLRSWIRKAKKIYKKSGFSGLSRAVVYRLTEKRRINRLKKKPPKLVENRILFESMVDFSDNCRALFDYMIKEGLNQKYEIIWLVSDPRNFSEYSFHNVKFLRKTHPWSKKRSAEAFRYALSSKYLFYSHALNWVGMARRGQLFIDLWHGCGYKGQNDSSRRLFFDYCLVPGELFVQTKKEYFRCSSQKILPLGYPRYDMMLHGSDVARAYSERLKAETNSVKLVLWMPTYRHSTSKRLNEESLTSDFNIPIINCADQLVQLDRFCRDNGILLLIKRHQLQVPYDFGDNPLTNVLYLEDTDLVNERVQLYEFIHYSDALITDYSSVAIDYLLLDRQIGFTLDDYEAYSDSRGWVFDNPLDYMPGEHIFDFQGFQDFLMNVRTGKDQFHEKRAEVIAVAHNQTENYCQRILDYFAIT